MFMLSIIIIIFTFNFRRATPPYDPLHCIFKGNLRFPFFALLIPPLKYGFIMGIYGFLRNFIFSMGS